MNNRTLTEIEKEQIKQFISNIYSKMFKLTKAQTLFELKDLQEELDEEFDRLENSIPEVFDEVTKIIKDEN